MAQWGSEKTYGSARFLCFVDTEPFAPIDPFSDHVDDVVLLDDGGDPEAAQIALDLLRKHCVGMPYWLWDSLLSNPDWTPSGVKLDPPDG